MDYSGSKDLTTESEDSQPDLKEDLRDGNDVSEALQIVHLNRHYSSWPLTTYTANSYKSHREPVIIDCTATPHNSHNLMNLLPEQPDPNVRPCRSICLYFQMLADWCTNQCKKIMRRTREDDSERGENVVELPHYPVITVLVDNTPGK